MSYLGHEPPEELADAWRRYQAGEDLDDMEMSELDIWRFGVAEDVADRARGESTNLVERLQQIIHSLDEIEQAVTDGFDQQQVFNSLDDARGVVGEVLTMIDGR